MPLERNRPIQVEPFFDAATSTISYLVVDVMSGSAAIIDSVLGFDPASGATDSRSAQGLIDRIIELRVNVEWILETHVHADHLSAAPLLQARFGGKLGIGESIRSVQKVFGKLFNVEASFRCDGSQFDHLFHDADVIQIGHQDCQILHTPGHTPACLTYIIGDVAFVGDTLFMPDYGTARCDFPGGDAHALYRSIRKILSLPPETRLFLCHDYPPGGRSACWETSVAEQRASNIHIHDGVTEEQFVAMRIARDQTLGMPTLMLQSVQVNMRAGQLPPPEDNGIRYLKIPIDSLGWDLPG